MRVHEDYVDAFVDVKRKEAIGQDSLFGGFGDDGDGGDSVDFAVLPQIPTIEWDKQTLLAFEREMLGLYVSDHPLFGIEHVLVPARRHLDRLAHRRRAASPTARTVTVAGLITGLQLKRTKKGDLWAIATVEDLDGAIECLFFPSAYMTVSTMLATTWSCVVRGRLNRRDETPTIFAQELTLPDIKEGPRGPVVVSLPLSRATNGGGRADQDRAR